MIDSSKAIDNNNINLTTSEKNNMNNQFLTRTQARAFRSSVNSKAKAQGSKAMLREPVKDSYGLWGFSGLNHGGKTLSINK